MKDGFQVVLRMIHRSCGSDPVLIEIHVPHAAAARLIRLRQETASGAPETGQSIFRNDKILRIFHMF